MEQPTTSAEAQPAPHPVQLVIPHPERSSRLLALATLLFFIPKILFLVPHLVILYFLGIVSMVCALLGQIVVLFAGHYPKGLFDIVAGMFRWQARVNAYLLGLTDAYPPFGMR